MTRDPILAMYRVAYVLRRLASRVVMPEYDVERPPEILRSLERALRPLEPGKARRLTAAAEIRAELHHRIRTADEPLQAVLDAVEYYDADCLQRVVVKLPVETALC